MNGTSRHCWLTGHRLLHPFSFGTGKSRGHARLTWCPHRLPYGEGLQGVGYSAAVDFIPLFLTRLKGCRKSSSSGWDIVQHTDLPRRS